MMTLQFRKNNELNHKNIQSPSVNLSASMSMSPSKPSSSAIVIPADYLTQFSGVDVAERKLTTEPVLEPDVNYYDPHSASRRGSVVPEVEPSPYETPAEQSSEVENKGKGPEKNDSSFGDNESETDERETGVPAIVIPTQVPARLPPPDLPSAWSSAPILEYTTPTITAWQSQGRPVGYSSKAHEDQSSSPFRGFKISPARREGTSGDFFGRSKPAFDYSGAHRTHGLLEHGQKYRPSKGPRSAPVGEHLTASERSFSVSRESEYKGPSETDMDKVIEEIKETLLASVLKDLVSEVRASREDVKKLREDLNRERHERLEDKKTHALEVRALINRLDSMSLANQASTSGIQRGMPAAPQAAQRVSTVIRAGVGASSSKPMGQGSRTLPPADL
uniref:Uncharacterized protein n=1 Tax=Rhizoctonia cerealis phyllomonavirus TaxID=3068671 RepID=A0AA51BT16_9MONO|nr:MAG: hypothetical protein [Rhizoctonia cerealis phyllomonavirus]